MGYRYRVEGDSVEGPTLNRRRRLEDESDLGAEDYVAHHELHAAEAHNEHHEDLHHHEKAKLSKFDVRFAWEEREVVEAGTVPSDVLVSIRISSKIKHSQRYRLKAYIMGVGEDEVSVMTKTGPAHEPYWDVHALRQTKSKAKKHLFGAADNREEQDEKDCGETGEEQDGGPGDGGIFGGENPMAAAQVCGWGVR